MVYWNITAQKKKDSNSSTWYFEIHPNYRLSDLKFGQTVKVQELQLFLSVRINFTDLLIQGWDLQNIIISLYSLLFLQLDGGTSHRSFLKLLHQIGDIAHCLVAELLFGNNHDLPHRNLLVWKSLPRCIWCFLVMTPATFSWF